MDEIELTVFCVNHPQTPTTLRCNRCNKPICAKCAVLTPTGYRCKECVRGQQKTFDTAMWYDYPLAFFLAGILSYIGSILVDFIGFFTLFVAPIAGVVIAEAVRFAVRRRRSKPLYQLSSVAAVLGSLPRILIYLAGVLLLGGGRGGGGLGLLLPMVWQIVYILGVSTTVYYRLWGIQI
jgi:hypothetical protein